MAIVVIPRDKQGNKLHSSNQQLAVALHCSVCLSLRLVLYASFVSADCIFVDHAFINFSLNLFSVLFAPFFFMFFVLFPCVFVLLSLSVSHCT